MTFSMIRRSWYSRLISLCIIVTFVTTMVVTPRASYAGVLGLPQPGTMVNLSLTYAPLMITGLTVHPENPLLMDFIVNTGNSGMTADRVRKDSDRLIKYFLACLTIPESHQWVNLSPYEKQHIIPEDLGQTVLGQDMLAQDYILKQLTASLIYPEKNLGKNFWDTVYTKAREMYGTSQIPVNTFNKVWILPEYAKVYEHNDTVFVVKSHLKVMLDEDYLALSRHSERSEESKGVNNLGNQIVRQIILPAIEQEVNQGQNFIQMRQIYNSMILAVWFKKNLKQALLNQVYTDRAKVNGVNVDDPAIKEKIYRQYLEAYKKGVFNYIKEETDPNTRETIPRKYFSGGEVPFDASMLHEATPLEVKTGLGGLQGQTFDVTTKEDAAMTATEQDWSDLKAQTESSIIENNNILEAIEKHGGFPDDPNRRAIFLRGFKAKNPLLFEMYQNVQQRSRSLGTLVSIIASGSNYQINQSRFESYKADMEKDRQQLDNQFGAEKAVTVPEFNLYNPVGHEDYWLQQSVHTDDLVADMFRDYDYRFESKDQDLNPALVFRLGLVWAKMALDKAKKAGIENRTVLIARDARKANPQIMDALVAAMRYSGLDVVFTAGSTSNAVTSYSWAVQQFKPLMSIFHTASHLSRPVGVYVRGFKVAIMDEAGGGVKSLTTKEIKQYTLPEVRKLLESSDEVTSFRGQRFGDFRAENVDENVIRFNTLVGVIAANNGSLYDFGEDLKKSDDPLSVLAGYEQKYANTQPLNGIKIVVDGSHTPSGYLSVETFKKLGAEVFSLNTDIQEIEGEHKADPSVKKNLVDLEAKIKETGAQFGLAFDLDGDRGAILVPESTGEVAYKEFHSLAPDNLLGVLLPSLINQWGYKQSGKELAIIRDVLGTHAVNDMGDKLGLSVYQTDAGYPFLKAKKQALEKEGVVVPMYGERSGHTWLHVSGEIENPLAVAVLFALLAKQKMDTKALSPVYDVYQNLSIPYIQSPRFQPLFHPELLKKLGESEGNTTSWRYDSNNPTNPPQLIIGLGKDLAIKLLQGEFVEGKNYETPAGNLIVKEFDSYADPADEGGLNRYADIVFEQNGKFAGRFVFRASSNDPTFVTSYEAPQWEKEDIQTTNKRKAAIAKLVLGFLMDNKIALVTKEDIAKSMTHLSAEQVDSLYNKSNLGPVEADLKDAAMLHSKNDDVLPPDESQRIVAPYDEAMLNVGQAKATLANPGGIDLNTRTLNMESSGQKVNITFDPVQIADFKRGDFSGVRIQILDVVPVDLVPLLGLQEA